MTKLPISDRLKHYQIPKYEEVFTSTKRRDYCVVICVINEGEKLIKQLSSMKKLKLNVDIIISDGGSNDGSTDEKLIKNLGVHTLLIKKEVGKLGTQMRIAFSWALENGYKGVVLVDGNNKDSVENINDFVEKLVLGYDHIQGSRFLRSGNAVNTPVLRLAALKLLHIPMINLASNFRYTDTTNGFRGYSKKLLLSDDMSIFRDIFISYEFHYYLAIQAAKLGYKCTEIPVKRIYPNGKFSSKISPLKGNLEIIIALFKACTGMYNVK